MLERAEELGYEILFIPKWFYNPNKKKEPEPEVKEDSEL